MKTAMCAYCKHRPSTNNQGDPTCHKCEGLKEFELNRDLIFIGARGNCKSYVTKMLLNSIYGNRIEPLKPVHQGLSAKVSFVDELHHPHVVFEGCPKIKNVIFAPPATIVMWSDNTKTVVKAENEGYDPEKGLAMAISRKALGNKHDYYNVFERWLKKYKKDQPYAPVTFNVSISGGFKKAAEAAKKAAESIMPI